jgi:polygalacturonase
MAAYRKPNFHYTLNNVRVIAAAAFAAVCVLPVTVHGADDISITSKAPHEIAPIRAPFAMPQFKRPTFPSRTFNITDYGAVEGGKVKNTQAIKKAITAANEAGGGKVLIPAGKWLTGAIHLESNVNLHLEKDALVLFSQELKDYLPAVFSRHEGMECYKPSGFIYARKCDNIAITGEGTLHGQGKPWWGGRDGRKMALDGKIVTDGTQRLNDLCTAGVPVEKRRFDGSEGDFVRPSFVNPVECKNVFIEGVTIKYGPMWTVNPVYCENVVVRKVTVQTEGEYGHTSNGDGVNPDSCKNVLIEYCDMDTGDDCFTIKSGRAEDGLRVGKPCENIVIRHSQGRQGHGGVVIGSETSGGIRNVFIRDCTFNGTDRGLRFKTARGRGATIENIWAQDLVMGEIVKEAIIVNTLRYTDRYPAHPVTDRTPEYRNLNFKNITCEYANEAAVRIVGLPEKRMEGLVFDNLNIKAARGIEIQDARDITFSNLNIVPDDGPVILLDQSSDVTFKNMTCPKGADPFVHLIGTKTSGVKLAGVDLSNAKKKVTCSDGALPAAVVYK